MAKREGKARVARKEHLKEVLKSFESAEASGQMRRSRGNLGGRRLGERLRICDTFKVKAFGSNVLTPRVLEWLSGEPVGFVRVARDLRNGPSVFEL